MKTFLSIIVIFIIVGLSIALYVTNVKLTKEREARQNQQDSGISKLDATKNGRKILFATRSKISVVKNHINGLGYTDGRIIVTPHGFIKDDKDEIAKYKKEHSDYWDVMLGSAEFDVVDSEVKPEIAADDE